MENSGTFLSVRNLVVEYTLGGEIIHAVNDVSFDLACGHTLALVGETGAGKTTIAKSILRILPDRQCKIKNGSIVLEGEDILKKSEREMLTVRGGKASMIFQDPMTALNPTQTVGQQIVEGLLLHGAADSTDASGGIARHDGGYHHHRRGTGAGHVHHHHGFPLRGGDAREMALDMLRLVGITKERFDEYPFQFSGGMKQRVVIAMALACKPKLLLADEPTTALDVTIQAQVLDMIKDLRDRLNTSMILITHDLGVVARMCDEAAVVYAGQILEYGDKRSIFKEPRHPYTRGLFGSLPSLSGNEKRLHPIQGLPPDPINLPPGCPFSPRCPQAVEGCKKGRIELRESTPGHFTRCVI
jgi:peptide/nickel transport system ATP-binding protein